MPTSGATSMKVEIDQASIDALVKGIAAALTKGAAQGAKNMTQGLGNAGAQAGKVFTQKFTDNFKRLDDQLTKALNNAMQGVTAAMGANIGKMVGGAQASLKSLSSVVERMARTPALDLASKNTNARIHMGNVMKGTQTNVTMGTAQFQSLSKERAMASAAERAQIMVDGRLAATAAANAGKLQGIAARKAADIATAESRQAGEMRVASHKAMWKQITMIEHAIGTAIAGTARTMASVVSKMFNATTSVLNKSFSAIGSIFHRSNSDTIAGLDGALNKRESLMRNSFGQQEDIVRKSTMRQREQMVAMQKQTSTGVLGSITGKGAGMGVGALVGGLGIAAWLKGGYEEAVNVNEQLNKTKVVFGESSAEVIKFASNAVNAFGSTKAEALTAAATFGNLFRAIGLTESQSAKMSTSMVQLAGDLSSFNNVPIEDAFAAIQSGLVGEQEPLRKFGVNLNDVTLKAKALQLGLFSGKGTLTASAKAQAAYALILEQTSLAQGDFARTMNEGANASRRTGKAMKEMAAAIMGYVMPVVTIAMNTITGLFTAMTAVIRDQTNPVIQLFKTAIKGAVIALAGLYAIKGIIELFKLLGPAIKLAMGPIGIFIIAVGSVGAIISVLMDRSKALRDSVHLLGSKFSDIGKKIADKFSPYLEGVGNFINDTVIPAIDSLASWLASVLVPAFDVTASFISDTLLPIFKTLVDVILLKLTPIILTFAFKVAEVFALVISKVVGFARVVRPLIQPLIDGFKILGEAMGAGFNGDWSKIGKGLGAAASGIGASAGNIGSAIMKALAPIAKKIWDQLLEVFSPKNLKRLAGGFLDLLYEIGKIVGEIATSPILVKAVLALVAVAVVIGAKLVQGLAMGIKNNLPELWGMLKSVLAAGFKLLLNNIGLVIGGAVLLGLFVPGIIKLVKAFKGFGAMAGKEFAGGMAGAMKKVSFGTDFFAGLMGSRGTGRSRAQAEMRKTVDGINRELAALGSTQVGYAKGALPGKGFAFINQSVVDDAKKKLDDVKKKFTEGQIAGRMMAYNIEQRFKLMNGVVGGVATSIGKSFTGAWKVVSGSFKGVSAALAATQAYTGAGTGGAKAFIGAFKTQVAGSGSAIMGGFKSAWASIGDYAKNTGTSWGKVLGTALAKGATAAVAAFGGFKAGQAEGAAGGSGMISALIGGVSAGAMVGGPWGAAVGVLTGGAALIGAAFGRAEAAAKKFREQVAQISSVFKSDLQKALDDGVFSLQQLKDGLSFTEVSGISDVSKQIADAVGSDALAAMSDYGLNIERDILPVLKRVGTDAVKGGSELRDMFINSASKSSDFSKRFGADMSDVRKALLDITAAGGDADINDWLGHNLSVGGEDEQTHLYKVIDANKKYLDGVLKNADALGKQAEAMIISTKKAADYANALLTDAQITAQKLGYDNVTNAIKAQSDAMKLQGIGQDEINAKLVEMHLMSPKVYADLKNNKDVTEAAATKAQTLADNLGFAKSAYDIFFNIPQDNSVQAAINAAVLASEGLGTRITDALKTGGVLGRAQLDEILGGVGPKLAAVLSSGVTSGLIVDKASAETALQPIKDVMLAGVTDQATKDLITKSFQDALDGIDANILAQKSAEAAVAGAQYLVDNPSWASDYEALFNTAGQASVTGYAKGIAANKMAAETAVKTLAANTIKLFRFSLGIASPSKVFKGFGGQLSKGLAIGIQQNMHHAVTAAGRMADLVAAAGMPGMDVPNPGQLSTSATRRQLASQQTQQKVVNQTQSNTNNIYLPHGDPAAVALAVSNRQASGLFG